MTEQTDVLLAADFPELHIYQQPSHHMPAHICGTRAGLEALRDAIGRALTGKVADEPWTFFQNDGEGYDLEIRLVDRAWWPAMPSAYTDFQNDWTPTESRAWRAAMDGRAAEPPKEQA